MSLIRRLVDCAGANRRIYVCAGLYFVALAVLGLVFHRMGDGESESDFFSSYVVQARSFLSGTIAIDPFRGPLYPIGLGIAYSILRLFGAGLFEAGILLSAASAAVILFVSYRLLSGLFGGRIAIVATALVVCNPIFVRFSYTAGTDMFFTALGTIAIYLTLKEPRLRWRLAVSAMLCAGLAYLTRYNGVAIVVGLLLYVLVVNGWRLSLKNRLVTAVAMMLVFGLTILPWSLYTLAERGALFYNNNYVNMAAGFYAGDGQMDHFLAENKGAFESFADVVRYNPVTFFVKIPASAWDYTRATMGWVMLWPAAFFILAGLIVALIRVRDRRQVGYFTFGLVYFATLWAVFYSERFVLLLIPMFATLAAFGIDGLIGLVRVKGARRTRFAAAVLVLVAFTAFQCVRYNHMHLPGGRIALRLMGEAFKERRSKAERGGSVIARKAYFAYFAGLDPLPLPIVNSHEELMAYIEETGADYLFYSGFAVQTRPGIRHLTNFQIKHPGLSPIAMTKIAVLYEVDKP